LDYNELKLTVLQLFSTHGPMNSGMLIKTLVESKTITLDIHALRMALMRYYKQGLLKRERSGGTYKYTISDRGIQRLRWLEEQVKNLKD
jgi:DNA-binding transcriptional regulator PaaX